MLVTLLANLSNKDCKTTELGFLVTLASSYSHFVETLGSHLKGGGHSRNGVFFETANKKIT